MHHIISFKVSNFLKVLNPVATKDTPVMYFLSSFCKDIPEGISTKPNLRFMSEESDSFQINVDHLENEESEDYSACNMGIKIFANKISYNEHNGMVTLNLEETNGIEMGICNGQHTYAAILHTIAKKTLKPQHWLQIIIVTNIKDKKTALKIAIANNKSQSIKPFTIDNKEGLFKWLQDVLKDTPYFHQILWTQNDKKPIEVRFIIALISILCTEIYPNKKDKRDLEIRHPYGAYNRKGSLLSLHRKSHKEFKKLKNLVKDLLYLYDIVNEYVCENYTTYVKGVTKYKTSICFEDADFAYFINKPITQKLHNTLIVPMLATLRIFVKKDSDGYYVWDRPFKEIEKIILTESCFLVDKAREIVGLSDKKTDKNQAILCKTSGTDLFNKRIELFAGMYDEMWNEYGRK